MKITLKFPDSIPAGEALDKNFLQGMLDRRAVAYHKYGSAQNKKSTFDYVKELGVRLKRYKKTGNTEWLMDVANCAALEFMMPSHPKAHFRPTDADESGGFHRKGERDPSQRHEREI